MAKSILPQLREKGKVTRGYLGVSIQDLSPDLAQAFGLDSQAKGALVQQVMPRSPAAKAGIEPGDVVVAMNGKPVETSGDLTRRVALIPPGEKVTLTVQRKSQKKDFSFAVAQRPDEERVARGEREEQPPEDAGKSPKLGLSLAPLTPELKRQMDVQADQGVVVAEVVPGGPADNAGIQRGDLVLEVNRQPVSKPEQVAGLVNKMKDGEMALLRVRRGDSAIFLAVPVGGRQ
jgi:serine protease Do